MYQISSVPRTLRTKFEKHRTWYGFLVETVKRPFAKLWNRFPSPPSDAIPFVSIWYPLVSSLSRALETELISDERIVLWTERGSRAKLLSNFHASGCPIISKRFWYVSQRGKSDLYESGNREWDKANARCLVDHLVRSFQVNRNTGRTEVSSRWPRVKLRASCFRRSNHEHDRANR